jgi:Fic family protein
MSEVFDSPQLDETDLVVVEMINEAREQMRNRIAEPRLWSGGLRRMAEARAVQASNSIEGYNATLDDVLAVQDEDEPMDADLETRFALAGYQEAMTYVLQATQDDDVVVDEGLLRALHFMMIKQNLSKNPGRWRPGAIHIERSDTHEIVYEAPDHDLIPTLIAAMLQELERDATPVIVKAAMAHLNLVMIHPFSDGNGRMARCLQTLVLARERVTAPVFASIEEYLGQNTQAYYEVLAEVGQGAWHPENDARPWVRFCLTAHYRQARTFIRRIEAFEQMWQVASRIAAERKLPERTIGPIAEAAYGLRVKRASYLRNVEITWGEPVAALTASRDLRALVTAGLFTPIGDTRGRYYVATEPLRQEWDAIRAKWPRGRDTDDPFKIAEDRRQLSFSFGDT